jgi:nucleotide-binding universal stress UspA family protein
MWIAKAKGIAGSKRLRYGTFGSRSKEMRIIVAYDGSCCAEAALVDLHRAGLQREAEVLAITVAERWLPRPSSVAQAIELESSVAAVRAPENGEDFELAYGLASQAKSRLQSYFTAWKIEAVAACGSPAQEILRKANEWSPDLIVLGCQGRSALARFLLGSVSQKVVNEAPCSVRVCRGTAWKDGSPVRMVIGLDSSPASQAAVSAVALRTWPMDSEVRLVAVIDPAKPRKAKPYATDAQRVSWVKAFVEAAEKKLRAAGLIVSSRIEAGDPKQVLVAEADEWGSDCVFLGAAASSSTTSALGDVSTAVVARVHCSVEIIRARSSRKT